MNRSSFEGSLLRHGLTAAVLAIANLAVAGETGYLVDYDYPGLVDSSPGALGSLSESWLDFGELGIVANQEGVDFPQSYMAELVGFQQGPPMARVRNAHTQYEFLYGSAGSCLQSVTYACSANLFEDRFESP